MAALVCLDCTAVYSVGADKCPQCGSTASRGDWEDAPTPAPAAPAKRGKNAPADAPPQEPTGGEQ